MNIPQLSNGRNMDYYYQGQGSNNSILGGLNIIYDVVNSLNSSPDLDDSLRLILGKIIEITSATRGFIILKNIAGQLECKLGMNSKNEEIFDEFSSTRASIIDYVFFTGQSKYLECKNKFLDRKNLIKMIPASILCTPIFSGLKTIGVIYIDSNHINLTQNKQITMMFEILALQIGMAITNNKKEEELKISKMKAENADKLKADFLAQISHEIRTPVNAMLSFAQFIKEETKDLFPEELIFGFDIIDNGGRRLIRTIDLILNVSDVRSGNYELAVREVDIAKEVLIPLVKEFTNLAGSKGLSIELVNNIRGDSIAECDHHTIVQIFTNLIDNAIKYTKEGGVTINLFRNEHGRLNVEVKDSGIGIAKEYLPKMFEPFSQEQTGYTRKYEGMGLGMSLVKKYAQLNNAEININSEKGSGTSFRIEFLEDI